MDGENRHPVAQTSIWLFGTDSQEKGINDLGGMDGKWRKLAGINSVDCGYADDVTAFTSNRLLNL